MGGKTQITVVEKGGPAQKAAADPLGQPAKPFISVPALPPASSPADRIRVFTVTGAVSHITSRVVVQLPRGYTDAANAQHAYPVLETFQGFPGGPTEFLDGMDLTQSGNLLTDQGKLAEMLIVAPQTEVPPGADSECLNGAHGYPQVETWLTVDIPNWIMHTFRVRPDRASWATMGLSAGGWCAAMVTMLHPDRFSAAIVFGGYFRPKMGAYRPFPKGTPIPKRYDLINLVKTSPPSVALWLETSHSDSTSYQTSAALLAATRPPMAVQSLVLSHAGHRLSIWASEMPGALTWLGTNVPGFSPTAAS
jgi:hypothetical protein